MRQRLSTWRQRFREHRIRERESTRAAREQADRAVNLAGLKRPPTGTGAAGA